MSHIEPGDVHSPKSEWNLIAVLRNAGPGRAALCVGRWNGKAVLGQRWNGTDQRPVGNPQSRGLATWFVVPDEDVDGILRFGGLSLEQVQMVQAIFNTRPIESFKGALVKVRDTEHQYQVRHIERLPFFAGRVYHVYVSHVLFLEREDEGLPNPTPLPPKEATFRFHFSFTYKPDPVLFGVGEGGDGKEIMARLPIILSEMHTLKPSADGIFDIFI